MFIKCLIEGFWTVDRGCRSKFAGYRCGKLMILDFGAVNQRHKRQLFRRRGPQ